MSNFLLGWSFFISIAITVGLAIRASYWALISVAVVIILAAMIISRLGGFHDF